MEITVAVSLPTRLPSGSGRGHFFRLHRDLTDRLRTHDRPPITEYAEPS
ncbi:hypothetical protein BKP43_48950 [Variovorax boronicumulans]|nr:hypothetical protein BKP43_48950 [Variovorax boronicumulans]